MKMTATQTGFYQGSLVRPGAHFDYDEKDGPLPKWAVPFGAPLPPAPTPFSAKPGLTMAEVQEAHDRRVRAGLGDSKPLDAQLAVFQKTGTRPSDPVETYGFF